MTPRAFTGRQVEINILNRCDVVGLFNDRLLRICRAEETRDAIETLEKIRQTIYKKPQPAESWRSPTRRSSLVLILIDRRNYVGRCFVLWGCRVGVVLVELTEEREKKVKKKIVTETFETDSFLVQWWCMMHPLFLYLVMWASHNSTCNVTKMHAHVRFIWAFCAVYRPLTTHYAQRTFTNKFLCLCGSMFRLVSRVAHNYIRTNRTATKGPFSAHDHELLTFQVSSSKAQPQQA